MAIVFMAGGSCLNREPNIKNVWYPISKRHDGDTEFHRIDPEVGSNLQIVFPYI